MILIESLINSEETFALILGLTAAFAILSLNLTIR